MTEKILDILADYPLTDLQRAWCIVWIANAHDESLHLEPENKQASGFDAALLAALLREMKQIPMYSNIQGVLFPNGENSVQYDLQGRRVSQIKGPVLNWDTLNEPEEWANTADGQAVLETIPLNQLLRIFDARI